MKHRYNSAPSTADHGAVVWDSASLGTYRRPDGARRARKRLAKRIREALSTVKLAPVRKHKDRVPSPPSWPSSHNQCAQTRPLIVMRPMRALRILMDQRVRDMGIAGGLKPADVRELMSGGSIHPKHFLDRMVLSIAAQSRGV